jgi:hypothetical protein
VQFWEYENMWYRQKPIVPLHELLMHLETMQKSDYKPGNITKLIAWLEVEFKKMKKRAAKMLQEGKIR